MKNNITTIVFFRRDLRIPDNHAILKAIEETPENKFILPIFCFDPKQINPENSYRSAPAILFMTQCLLDLHKQLQKYNSKLFILYGNPSHELQKLFKELPNLKTVCLNGDVTPYSRERDEEIGKLCERSGIQLISTWGEFMNPPGTILTGSGTYYQKFTPFYVKASKIGVAPPSVLPKSIPFARSIRLDCETDRTLESFVPELPDNFEILHLGGRTVFLERWNDVKKLGDYEKTRDFPAISTTEWSAALKFGCVSIREAMAQLKRTVGLQNGIARQLFFREFYYQVMYENPRLLRKGESFLEKWNDYPYGKVNQKWFQAWKTGMTGFPIIDAGMRQMLQTGFMHNRVRMLAASLLNKDMGIDWRMGEKFFGRHLYDYDPTQNNSGWQSTCGMGASALDWMRVMNPWIQTEKYDPDCVYIKEWIPELRLTPNEVILKWVDSEKPVNGYPPPIISHQQRAKEYLTKTRQFL